MKYSISILCHNNANLTKRCIESIFHAGTEKDEAELIITNNGSSDDTADLLDRTLRNRPHIRIITNEKNEGFIQPNMRALFHANGDYFVMLNNDCVVSKGWLDRLSEPFSNPVVKLVGLEGACGSLTPEFRGYHGYDLEYLEGSCLMGQTAFLRQIGLFDDNLVGAYGEDADLSLRVRKMGYVIRAVRAGVTHLGGMTSALVPESKDWFAQNMTYLRKKWEHYLVTKTF